MEFQKFMLLTVLQKHFLPDPCLIYKGTTFLEQNTSQKQQNMF